MTSAEVRDPKAETERRRNDNQVSDFGFFAPLSFSHQVVSFMM